MPHFRWAAAVLTLSLCSAAGAAHFWHPPLESFPIGVASANVPKQIAGDKSLGDLAPGDYLMGALPGSKMLFRTYGTRPDTIDFLLLSGTAGVALHDPRLCLSGYRLSDPNTLAVPGTPIVMQTYAGCTTAGLPDVSVSYFYVVGNQVLSSRANGIAISQFQPRLVRRTAAVQSPAQVMLSAVPPSSCSAWVPRALTKNDEKPRRLFWLSMSRPT